MLDTSDSNLLTEIDAAEKVRDDHLASAESQIARYHGPSWNGAYDYSKMEYDPANTAFQYIGQTISAVAFDNPRYNVSSKRGASQREVAIVMRHAMNRWAQDTDVQVTAEQLYVDMQFTWGVSAVVQMPTPWSDPGAKEPRMLPQMVRISNREHGIDPLAKDVRDARFQFNKWVMDKEDLEQRAKDHPEEGWNLDEIKKLTVDVGTDKLARPEKANVTRKEIVGYVIWIPEEELEFTEADRKKYKADSWREAGFNGVLRTIAVARNPEKLEKTARGIRDPQPYYGPPDGPYSIFGAYYVPDSATPLGVLTAVESQNQEYNAHKRAYLRSAARRKKIGIVAANDTVLQGNIKNAEDGDVVVGNVRDLAASVGELELGGPTAEQRLTILDLGTDLKNSVGASDATAGNVTGVGTATENQIAAMSGSARRDWINKKYNRAFTNASRKVAYYFVWDNRIAFALGEEAAEELGMAEPWFHGAEGVDDPSELLNSLELDIEPMSTARTDEALSQQRATLALGFFERIVALAALYPNSGVEKIVPVLAERFHMPELADILDMEGLAGDAQALAELGAGGQAPGGKAPTPQRQPPSGNGRNPRPSPKIAPSSSKQSAGAQQAKRTAKVQTGAAA